MQNAWCKESNLEIEVFSESDTYPRDRFHTPASYSECFHLATLAADNMPTLKYMYDYMCAPDYETGYVDAHVRNLPLQKQIAEHFSGKRSVGIRVYETMRKLKDAELGDLFPAGDIPTHAAEKELMQRYAFSSAQMILTPHAIPTVYEGEGLCGIAFGENARILPNEARTHGLILDIKAAQILQARGIDVGLLSAKPMMGGFMELFEGVSPDTDLFNTTEVYRITVKEGAEVISHFVSNEFCSDEQSPAAYRYENAEGERFLVYAFDAERQVDSSSLYWSYGRGRQIADQIAWLGGEPLPFRCERHPQLYAVCKRNDDALAIALINCHEDEIVSARVDLSEKIGEITFLGCTGKRLDAHTLLIDYVKPFGFAALEARLS